MYVDTNAESRCVAKEDDQKSIIDFITETLYASVAIHEDIRLLIPFYASTGLVIEGGDFPNVYLFDELDIPVNMEQRENHLVKIAIRQICKLP